MTLKRKDYISWDEYFMGVAKLSALRSKDPSTQVGACIVNDENIKFIYPTSMEVDGSIAPFSYEYTTEDKVIHAGYFFIVDTDIQMIPESDPGHYHNFVLTFYFNGNKVFI